MQTKKDSTFVVGQVKQQNSAAISLAPSDSAAKTAKEITTKSGQINISHSNQVGTKREKSQNNSASKERANSGSQKHGLKNKSISPSTQKKTAAVLMTTLKQKLKSQNNQNGFHYLSQKKQHNMSAIQYNNNNGANTSNHFLPQQASISSIIQQQCQQINKQVAQQFQSTQPYLQSNQKHTNSSGIDSIENLLSATSHANRNNTYLADSKIPLKNSLSTSNMNNQSDSKSTKKKQQVQNSSISHIYGKQQFQNQQQQIQHLASMTSQSISNSSQRKQASNKNLQLQSLGNQQQQNYVQSSTDSSSSLNLNQIQGFSTNFKYDQLCKRIDTFWSSNMYSYQTDESNMKNYFDNLFSIFDEYKNQTDMKLINTLYKVLMNPIQKMIVELERLNDDKSKLLKDNEERRNEARHFLQQVETLQHKNDQYSEILKQIQDHQFRSPLLEKIFTENQKLNKLVIKQKHKIHEIRKKVDKIMKLLYFIRKEGIDVDKIYKQHMQTPRNETSSEDDSFMMMEDHVFDEAQRQHQFINSDEIEEYNNQEYANIQHHQQQQYNNYINSQNNNIQNMHHINQYNNQLQDYNHDIQQDQNQLSNSNRGNLQMQQHIALQENQSEIKRKNQVQQDKSQGSQLQSDSKTSQHTLNFGNSSQKKDKLHSGNKNQQEIIKIVEDHFIEQQIGKSQLGNQNKEDDEQEIMQEFSSIQPNNNNINESSSKKQFAEFTNHPTFKVQNDNSKQQIQSIPQKNIQVQIFSNREYFNEDQRDENNGYFENYGGGGEEEERYIENGNEQLGRQQQIKQKLEFYQDDENRVQEEDYQEEGEYEDEEGYDEQSEETDYNQNQQSQINKNHLKQQQQYFKNQQNLQVPYFGNIPDLYLNQQMQYDEQDETSQEHVQQASIKQLNKGNKTQMKNLMQNSF